MEECKVCENNAYRSFIKGIIFWGRITLLGALVISFIPAIYLAVVHGAMPSMSTIFTSFSMVASVIVVSWIVEPFAYFPVLGITGTYMAWLSGNISNLRLPVSAVAQQAAGVKEGSPQGDIVSTLGMGVSVVTNLIILSLGAMLGAKVISNVPPVIEVAFNYILPAVFGAVLASFSLRSPKLATFAVPVALIFTYLKSPMWIVLPLCVFGTIFVGRWMFNKGWIK